jgi:hypothetical protein
MCSSKDLVTEPFVRFGHTEASFNDLRMGHYAQCRGQQLQLSRDELPFLDSAAQLIRQLLEGNKDNVPLCSLVAAMVYCVYEGEVESLDDTQGLTDESLIRFGITLRVFNDLRVAHDVMNCSQPRTRSCDELPFFDWEAALLRKVLLDNQDNVPLCSLMAAMMYYVHESVQKKLGRKKPARQNTYGMFFAPPTSAEQAVKA